MLQENRRFRRTLLPLAWAVVLVCARVTDAPAGPRERAAATPVVPLTVCEVLRDLPAQTGKVIAVMGRYSYRETGGSWVSEDSCEPPLTEQPGRLPELWMTVDRKGPPLPDDYELDGAALHKKLAEMQRHTTLAKFRFGTPDFDRWAVIWGKVEPRKSDDGPKVAADLSYRGEGTIYQITQ